MAGLVQDKDAILGSLDSVSALASETADLIDRHPALLRPASRACARSRQPQPGTATRSTGPCRSCRIKLEKIGRTAIYGSFFNFYLCQFQGNVNLGRPSLPDPVRHLARRQGREVQPPMSNPFRERNPVNIGAISIAVIIALLVAARSRPRTAADRWRRHLPRRLHRLRWHQAQRRGPDRRRPRRQGHRGRARRRPREVTFKIGTPSKFGNETNAADQGQDPARARCSSPSSPRARASSRRAHDPPLPDPSAYDVVAGVLGPRRPGRDDRPRPAGQVDQHPRRR